MAIKKKGVFHPSQSVHSQEENQAERVSREAGPKPERSSLAPSSIPKALEDVAGPTVEPNEVEATRGFEDVWPSMASGVLARMVPSR